MSSLQQDLGPEFESLSLPEALKKPSGKYADRHWKLRLQRWLQRLRRYG